MNKHTSKGLLPLNCITEFHPKRALPEGGLREWCFGWHYRALYRALREVILCGREHMDDGREWGRGGVGWCSRSLVSSTLPPTGFEILDKAIPVCVLVS